MWYIALLVMSVIVLLASIYFDRRLITIISASIVVLLAFVLLSDKKFVHVPPKLIILVILVMVVSMISNIDPEIKPLNILTYVLLGIVFSIIGLIVFYVSLGKKPGFLKEKRFLVALQSFTFGIAINFIWIVIAFVFGTVYAYEDMILNGLCVMIGSLLVSVTFIFDGNFFMRGVVNEFLTENSDVMEIDEDIVKETKDMIMNGESYSLEFKSTIRTNLETNEIDKRMENAMLKSIAAFLNSEGGTLLVGVKDDGNILGVDIECFDNRDKMNLHISNLISSRIGDEFIPFIKLREMNFGKKENGADKIVIRFDCEPTLSPVFLKNPKDKSDEIFYVRSGPSTIELTGSELLKYIENRKKTGKKKYHAASKLN